MAATPSKPFGWSTHKYSDFFYKKKKMEKQSLRPQPQPPAGGDAAEKDATKESPQSPVAAPELYCSQDPSMLVSGLQEPPPAGGDAAEEDATKESPQSPVAAPELYCLEDPSMLVSRLQEPPPAGGDAAEEDATKESRCSGSGCSSVDDVEDSGNDVEDSGNDVEDSGKDVGERPYSPPIDKN